MLFWYNPFISYFIDYSLWGWENSSWRFLGSLELELAATKRVEKSCGCDIAFDFVLVTMWWVFSRKDYDVVGGNVKSAHKSVPVDSPSDKTVSDVASGLVARM